MMKLKLLLIATVGVLYINCGPCVYYPFAEPGVKSYIRETMGIQCPTPKP